MGVDPTHPINTVDVEYDLFWREVIDAVKHVELNHGLSYRIERGTREAYINWDFDWPNGIKIYITEVEPKQPALIVPGTGEDK